MKLLILINKWKTYGIIENNISKLSWNNSPFWIKNNTFILEELGEGIWKYTTLWLDGDSYHKNRTKVNPHLEENNSNFSKQIKAMRLLKPLKKEWICIIE